MSEHDPERGGRTRQLMMGRLDRELTPEESEALDQILESDPAARQEWEQLKLVKTITAGIRLRTPPDEIWEGYMNSVYRRIERGVGWILVSIGAIVLLSYGLWSGVGELLRDTTVPWYLRGAVMSLLAGFAVIVVSVVREKFFMRKRDPYREVER